MRVYSAGGHNCWTATELARLDSTRIESNQLNSTQLNSTGELCYERNDGLFAGSAPWEPKVLRQSAPRTQEVASAALGQPKTKRRKAVGDKAMLLETR